MKNIILDGQTYSGISEVSLPISGGTALFKDKDEIIEPSGSLSITANGTYDVTDKASAVVAVPAPEINLQNKTATANGEVTADEGYDGLGVVTVAVSGDVPTLITKSITANGTYNASADSADGYSSVTVNVPAPVLPTLTNPASASDIAKDKEAIDGSGNKIVGTNTFDADTSDADAVASDIAQGKTAYVNGVKLTGTASGGGASGIGLDQFDDNHWMAGFGQGGNLKMPDNVQNTTSQFYPSIGTLSGNNEMTFWLINVEAGKTYRVYTTDNANVSWDWCQMSWIKSFETGLGWIKRDTSATGTYISEYTATAPAGAAYMQFGARRMGDNDAYKTIRIEEVT